jgi:RNA polymerase sigma-70 factor (ECF subfamily)
LADLMGRYCDGDRDAFRALYAALAPRLLGYLIGLTGERATAEDLLQQTFLKLHEARPAYVRGADPVPWIYTIAHRTCLDELRRRRRSRVKLTEDGSLADSPSTATAPDPEPAGDRAGEEGLSRATRAALAQLPANQREALLLTKVHGRSVREAAVITGSTPGAIKLRAHRAYVTLRQLLGKREAS